VDDFEAHLAHSNLSGYRVENLENGKSMLNLVNVKNGKIDYVIAAGSAQGIEGAEGIVCVFQERDCDNSPEILHSYSPNESIDILMEARDIRKKIGNKVRWAGNMALGVAQIALFWPIAMGMAEVAGLYSEERTLPIWTVPILAAEWSYVLLDGYYRTCHNVSLIGSGILKKIERKK